MQDDTVFNIDEYLVQLNEDITQVSNRYNRSSKYHDICEKISTVMSIVGATYSTFGLICTSVSNDTCQSLEISAIILNGVVLIISTLAAIYKPGGKAVSHRTASLDLAALCLDIKKEMVRPQMTDRGIVDEIFTRYTLITKNEPLPWYTESAEGLTSPDVIRTNETRRRSVSESGDISLRKAHSGAPNEHNPMRTTSNLPDRERIRASDSTIRSRSMPPPRNLKNPQTPRQVHNMEMGISGGPGVSSRDSAVSPEYLYQMERLKSMK